VITIELQPHGLPARSGSSSAAHAFGLRGGFNRLALDIEVGAKRLRQREGLRAATDERQRQRTQVDEDEPRGLTQSKQQGFGQLQPRGAQQRSRRDRLAMKADEWLKPR
jgi:hypothetical protein